MSWTARAPGFREAPGLASTAAGNALKDAKVVLSDWTMINCTIRDVNEEGARLVFSGATSLPEEFRQDPVRHASDAVRREIAGMLARSAQRNVRMIARVDQSPIATHGQLLQPPAMGQIRALLMGLLQTSKPQSASRLLGRGAARPARGDHERDRHGHDRNGAGARQS